MPSHHHLQHVIESAIDFAIIVTDLDGRITEWNAGAESILGWSRDEIVGASADRIFTPQDRAEDRIGFEMRTALTDGRANDERWHLRKGEQRFWASGEMMPLRSEDGIHHGYVKILRDRTRQHEAGKQLRETQDRFQTLLQAIDTAFALVEVKFDADDNAIDYRFIQANPAFERQAGVDLQGKWVTEFAPNLERFWFETYGRVALTGEPAHFENHAKAFGRWFDVRAIRVGAPEDRQIAIFFTDTTARRELQMRNAAIQELSDKLSGLTKSVDIAATSAEILGRTLDASLVGYGTVAPDAETIFVERDWAAPGAQPLPNVICIRDFGTYEDDLRRGETVIVPDAAIDPRTSSSVEKLEAIGARAFINLPIIEQDRFVALIYVGQKEPRAWTNDEVIFLRDVAERIRAATERARREKELAQSEAGLRRAQEAGGVGLFTVELADDTLFATPQFYRLYGLPEQERYEATAIQKLVIPEDVHLVSTVRSRAIGEPIRRVEYRIRRADTGEVRWISRTADIESDAAGRPVRFVGAALDITERRASEDRLRESEASTRENVERVRLALSAGAIIGTWFWDLPTDRFTVDEAFATAFGLDLAHGREGIPLTQIVETVHPDDQAGLAAAIEEAIKRGGNYAHQYRTRRADGKYYWLEANGRVDHAPDGTPLSFPGVLIDVEERRAVEAERDRAAAELRALNETLEQRVADRSAELMKAEEQLRQSQKMEAVGQLTGGMAHDFNNLLTGIIGSLDMMQRRIHQGRFNDVERYVTSSMTSANRAAALTHRLLAFSRRQTLDPKLVDPNQLIAGMEDLLRRTIGPGISLETVLPAGTGPTLCDPNQLENVLLNLAINARDAMPDGGTLRIDAANVEIDETFASDRDMPAGPYVSLSVSDTGSGMSPDVIRRAFDPFFTTKPLGEGTGLGLSMIYGFTKQSGGQVRIHSEESIGTTVTLYLPLQTGEAEQLSKIGVQAMARSTVGELVLVVDDEPAIRMLIVDVLKELGYRAVEANDGKSGLAQIERNAKFDLLVTDVGLAGGMNGRQLADAARQRHPDLKVLFITGFAENIAIGGNALASGMQMLTKPFTMEALTSRIRAILSGEQ